MDNQQPTDAELYDAFVNPRVPRAEIAALSLESATRIVAYRRKSKVSPKMRDLSLSDEGIAEAIVRHARSAYSTQESRSPVAEGHTVSDDELRQMQAQQRRRAEEVPWTERDTHMERQRARNWYWWLWLSPLLTIPTLAFFLFQELGYDLICQNRWLGCDWGAAERVTVLIAVLASALWHLVLLIPALNKEHPFVRWHGRQALLLAGMRTAVPLGFGLAFGRDYGALFFIPVQIAVWLGGTLWGQRQAARGNCSLMRWSGQEELLASLQRADEEARPVDTDAEALIATIRSSRDAEVRRRAIAQLKKLGMVEPL
jgi:hypothetical protein